MPQFGLNAPTLRFLDFLSQDIIKADIEGILINLPHPANFALHKLIIFQRRKNPEKVIKDKEAAIKLLKALIDKDEINIIKEVFNSVPKKWQGKILKGLKEAKEYEIASVLRASQ